jgi:hypothetical protein
MPPVVGGHASDGSAEAITRAQLAARSGYEEPNPIEPQRRSRSSTSPGQSPSRGVAPIANLTASLAEFGHDPLRERVRSGAAAVSFARSEAEVPNSTIGRMSS